MHQYYYHNNGIDSSITLVSLVMVIDRTMVKSRFVVSRPGMQHSAGNVAIQEACFTALKGVDHELGHGSAPPIFTWVVAG